MTYADQMSAIGADADAAIAAKSQKPLAHTHQAAATTTGNAADAALAAAQPPPPVVTTKTVYGISAGDSASASAQAVGTKRMRTYNQGQLKAAIAAGVTELWHSEKIDQAKLAGRDSATMASVKSLFTAVPKGRVTVNHERDNDTAGSGWTSAANQKDAQQYQASQLVFGEIIAAINKTRDAAHQLLWSPITTGQVYVTGKPEWWIVTAAPEVGVDCYAQNTYAKIFAALQRLVPNLPWAIGETGVKAGGDPTVAAADDTTMVTRMTGDNKIYTGFKKPPAAVFWWNQGYQDLTQRPKSKAQWTNYSALG